MADEHPIGADEVARKQFGTAFRGFDQYEVRAFLAQVGAELASLHEREKALRERLAAAEEQHRSTHQFPEDEIEAALGAETTRVLHAAREAAAEIRGHAEESVARMLREANDDVSRMRTEAETVLGRRTEEAESLAAGIVAAAEERARALEAESTATAAAAIDEAQQRGREMLAEAQAVRERVLKDLSRRRKAAAVQLEQLLAGRERLLAAYDVVRGTLDEATHELSVAESEARLAADVAGFRAPPEESAQPEEAEVVPEPVAAPVPELAVEHEHIGPAPALAPDPPAGSGGDDHRRSSSLRLLRRRQETTELPHLEAEIESVRIIRPASPPAGPAPTPAPVSPPVAAPEPEPEQVEALPDHDEHPVEDLFARLRADRAAAVAQAEEVLAAPPADAEVDVEAEAELAPPPAADAVFEQRDAALEPAERALTRALKRVLADEQNEVLDALRRLRGRPTVEALLPGPDDHAGRYVAMAAKHLAAGAASGAVSVGGDPADVSPLADAFGAELADDLRSRVERALETSGSDDEALVEAISATYREWKTARGEPLARHHLAAAYAFGVFTAAPADELLWVVDAAEGGCPDCDDNALAGPTRKGEPYPTGQPHPPAHAGCRCLVLPAS